MFFFVFISASWATIWCFSILRRLCAVLFYVPKFFKLETWLSGKLCCYYFCGVVLLRRYMESCEGFFSLWFVAFRSFLNCSSKMFAWIAAICWGVLILLQAIIIWGKGARGPGKALIMHLHSSLAFVKAKFQSRWGCISSSLHCPSTAWVRRSMKEVNGSDTFYFCINALCNFNRLDF